MNNTIKLLAQEFVSSSDTTEQFKKYASTFKREVSKRIRDTGGMLVSFNRGHFYVSGFFTVNGQMYYFSQSDVRWFKDDNILVRTAKSDKDYTGGANNYSKLDNLFSTLPR